MSEMQTMNHIAMRAVSSTSTLKMYQSISNQLRWSIAATIATLCTIIFNLPRSEASIVNPSEDAIARNPLTKNSREMMMTATHAGTTLGLNWTNAIKAPATISLSESGSSNMPSVVT